MNRERIARRITEDFAVLQGQSRLIALKLRISSFHSQPSTLSTITSTFVLITCEHGGNRIPSRYREFFRDREALMQSHHAYDRGALQLAQDMAAAHSASLFVSTISRLLIDLNRSPGHPKLYSEAIRRLSPEIRREILQRYYLPYRSKVETTIAQAVDAGTRVIHVSCHSFTPEFDGRLRDADIGLLYDPVRMDEARLCRHWQAALKNIAPQLCTRMNYPYKGISDGLATHLRRRFGPEHYLGIELEVNQKHVHAHDEHWPSMRKALVDTFRETVKLTFAM